MHSPELEPVFRDGWGKGTNKYPGTECGPGSMIENTHSIREALPGIIDMTARLMKQVPLIIDVGAGDLAWLQTVPLPRDRYQGFDVCERKSWEGLRSRGWQLEKTDFRDAKIAEQASLVLCRDVMIHLPNQVNVEMLEKIRNMSCFLLATTYTCTPGHIMTTPTKDAFSNYERMHAATTKHAMLDLRYYPFSLNEPMLAIAEHYPGKYMGLWDLRQ